MIEAALRGDAPLLLVFAALALCTGLPALWLARRFDRPQPSAAGAAVAGSLVLAVTLYPLHPRAPASRVCSVNREVLSALLAPQGLLNIALFVPLACFLTVLTRRPLPVFTAAALLSGVIEIAQALVPGMGRACDSADLTANVAGALAGSVVGELWCRFAPGSTPADGTSTRTRARRADLRLSSAIGITGAVVLAAVALPTVLITVAEADDAHRADPAQTAAAAATVREFFGASATPTRVQYTPGSHGRPGRLEVASPEGSLVLDWPSREVRSGRLAAADPTGPGAPVLADADARAAARGFAALHFPWARDEDADRITPAGGPDSQARLVSWRSRVDGVLMPMRLDVIVGADRRILAFSAADIAAPRLPAPVLTQEQAQQKALELQPGTKATGGELMAKQDRQGEWHVAWFVALTRTDPTGPAPAPGASGRPEQGVLPVFIDAVTGLPFSGADLAGTG